MDFFDEILSMVMEGDESATEGLFDGFKKKSSQSEFTPITIDSPIGPLVTLNKEDAINKTNPLCMVEPISFSLFGNKYEQKVEFSNIGTNNDPKYNPKEIEAYQKALKIISSKKNTIKKSLYDYFMEFEEEYFYGHDYNYKTGESKTCRSLMNDAVCKKFYTDISLELITYEGTAIAYLNLWNKIVLSDGLVCTLYPTIRVDSWESTILDDIADEYH